MFATSCKKYALKLLMLLMIMVLLVSGCAATGKETVAVVNGTEISLEQLEKNYLLIEKAYKEKFSDTIMTDQVEGKTVREVVRLEILQKLVNEVLIVQYMESKGYKPANEEIDTRYNDFMAVEIEKTPENSQFYEKNKIDKKFIRNSIKTQLYLSAFEKQIREEVVEKNNSIETLYKDYVVQIQAQHILVKDEVKALEIVERLKKGENFAEVAKAMSQDEETAVKGGDLGVFDRKVMPVEFTQVAFAMKVGETSAPVKTKFGYHLIKVNKKITLQEMMDEEADPLEIEREKTAMLENVIQEKKAKMLEDLLAKASVQRFEDRVK